MRFIFYPWNKFWVLLKEEAVVMVYLETCVTNRTYFTSIYSRLWCMWEEKAVKSRTKISMLWRSCLASVISPRAAPDMSIAVCSSCIFNTKEQWLLHVGWGKIITFGWLWAHELNCRSERLSMSPSFGTRGSFFASSPVLLTLMRDLNLVHKYQLQVASWPLFIRSLKCFELLKLNGLILPQQVNFHITLLQVT